jgi:hypothetical protein
MQLSDKQIQAFIECWKKDFGEVLPPEQARVEALRLLEFFAAFAEMVRLTRRPTADGTKSIPKP